MIVDDPVFNNNTYKDITLKQSQDKIHKINYDLQVTEFSLRRMNINNVGRLNFNHFILY